MSGVHSLIGKKAPDFSLNDQNGEQVKLSKLKGKVVLLNFFTTWSKASLRQAQCLEKFVKKYKKQGLVVIGITSKKNAEQVQKFVKLSGLTYPIIPGNRKQFKVYKVTGIPTTYYIDKDGKVCYCDVGARSGNEKNMEARIERMLKASKE